MKLRKIAEFTPTKMAICYLAWLVLAGLLCIWAAGTRTLVEYAIKDKPYLVVRTKYFNQSLLDSSSSAKFICFGDSNYFYPPDKSSLEGDPDTHMTGLIREAVSTLAEELEVGYSEWAFGGADTFAYYCMFFEAMKFAPDLIIVPINWRSFGPHWLEVFSKPHYPELSAFVPISHMFPSGYENPVRSRGISASEHIGYKFWFYYAYALAVKNWLLESRDSLWRSFERPERPGTQALGMMNFLEFRQFGRKAITTALERKKEENKAELARKMATDRLFTMNITSSNPTFIHLCALLHVASERDTKILFYTYPIDEEFLTSEGVFDRSAFERSRELIIGTIKAEERENIYFVDLSDLLEHEHFSDIAGHFTLEGRRKVAEALAPTILEILRSEPSSL